MVRKHQKCHAKWSRLIRRDRRRESPFKKQNQYSGGTKTAAHFKVRKRTERVQENICDSVGKQIVTCQRKKISATELVTQWLPYILEQNDIRKKQNIENSLKRHQQKWQGCEREVWWVRFVGCQIPQPQLLILSVFWSVSVLFVKGFLQTMWPELRSQHTHTHTPACETKGEAFSVTWKQCYWWQGWEKAGKLPSLWKSSCLGGGQEPYSGYLTSQLWTENNYWTSPNL